MLELRHNFSEGEALNGKKAEMLVSVETCTKEALEFMI